jgi:hypothetical protein
MRGVESANTGVLLWQPEGMLRRFTLFRDVVAGKYNGVGVLGLILFPLLVKARAEIRINDSCELACLVLVGHYDLEHAARKLADHCLQRLCLRRLLENHFNLDSCTISLPALDSHLCLRTSGGRDRSSEQHK